MALIIFITLYDNIQILRFFWRNFVIFVSWNHQSLFARFESIEIDLPVQSICEHFSNLEIGINFGLKNLCEFTLTRKLCQSLTFLLFDIEFGVFNFNNDKRLFSVSEFFVINIDLNGASELLIDSLHEHIKNNLFNLADITLDIVWDFWRNLNLQINVPSLEISERHLNNIVDTIFHAGTFVHRSELILRNEINLLEIFDPILHLLDLV